MSSLPAASGPSVVGWTQRTGAGTLPLILEAILSQPCWRVGGRLIWPQAFLVVKQPTGDFSEAALGIAKRAASLPLTSADHAGQRLVQRRPQGWADTNFRDRDRRVLRLREPGRRAQAGRGVSPLGRHRTALSGRSRSRCRALRPSLSTGTFSWMGAGLEDYPPGSAPPNPIPAAHGDILFIVAPAWFGIRTGRMEELAQAPRKQKVGRSNRVKFCALAATGRRTQCGCGTSTGSR